MIQNNLKNIFDNYNRKLGKNKISLYQLSKITGTPWTTLKRLINDPNKSMNNKTLNNLIEFFSIPVNKMIIYQRNPYKFKLINASQLSSNKLPKRVQSHLSRSVALRSVDYRQTIIFTPLVSIKSVIRTPVIYNEPFKTKINYLIYQIKYADITKYPVYNAIQCSNMLNIFHLPLNHSASFYLMSYIASVAILHSGLISKRNDYDCNHNGTLEANFKGLKSTTHNSNYFKLNSRLSSSIMINHDFDRPKSTKLGYFESQINYDRKHFGKSSKSGYTLKFPHVELSDQTTFNFAK